MESSGEPSKSNNLFIIWAIQLFFDIFQEQKVVNCSGLFKNYGYFLQ